LKPFRAFLAAGVAAGTLLLTAAVPAMAAPAPHVATQTTFFYGEGYNERNAGSAVGMAYNFAYQQAINAGFSGTQCTAVGTAEVNGNPEDGYLADATIQCTR
jgi:hypothetical protein